MSTFRIELNDFLSEYINKVTHSNSGYISSGDFIRELIREHIRNNVSALAVNSSYDALTPVQRADAGKAAFRGTKAYEAWQRGTLHRNPGLSHAISEIDYELRQIAAEND